MLFSHTHRVALFSDDDRAFAYLRFETGDEMSRRAKFAFLTWIGPSVGALKKARVSTDKAFVKEVFVVSLAKLLLAEADCNIYSMLVNSVIKYFNNANHLGSICNNFVASQFC